MAVRVLIFQQDVRCLILRLASAKRQRIGAGLDEPILIELTDDESEAPRRRGNFLSTYYTCFILIFIASSTARERVIQSPGVLSEDEDEEVAPAATMKSKSRDVEQFFDAPSRPSGSTKPMRRCKICQYVISPFRRMLFLISIYQLKRLQKVYCKRSDHS